MRRIASSILLVILVAVTVGVPVYRHTCYVFDRSEVSLLTQKQCCSPEANSPAASIDFKCCSLEHFDTTMDYETLVEKSAFKVIQFITEVPVLSNPQVSVVEGYNTLPVLRPPPLANRDLLNKFQVYRL